MIRNKVDVSEGPNGQIRCKCTRETAKKSAGKCTALWAAIFNIMFRATTATEVALRSYNVERDFKSNKRGDSYPEAENSVNTAIYYYIFKLATCFDFRDIISSQLYKIHSLVFSLRGRAGRNQSPVMWPVWLWHTASLASSWGSLPLLSPTFRRSHFRRQVPVRPQRRERS